VIDHSMDQNKNIEDLLGEKGHLQAQSVAFEQQSGLKRAILSKIASNSKIFRSDKSHHGTNSGVSIGNYLIAWLMGCMIFFRKDNIYISFYVIPIWDVDMKCVCLKCFYICNWF